MPLISAKPTLTAASLTDDDKIVFMDGGSSVRLMEVDEFREALTRPIHIATWYVAGSVSTGTGTQVFDIVGDWTLTAVVLRVSTGTVTVDVNKNATTVFTNQANRPAVTSPTRVNIATTITVDALEDGDEMTVDIDVATTSPTNARVSLFGQPV